MTGRRMGHPDAHGRCVHCGEVIHRQWWGNGGWLWVHRDSTQVDCQPTTHAEPADDTVTELFGD